MGGIMRLSDLQLKMVVNIKDGKHLGTIIDADITESGQINFFIVYFIFLINFFIN